MRISLTLEAILGKYAPGPGQDCELPQPMSVGQLIGHLGIPESQVMFAIVDGQMANLDTMLHENASVSLCPYICGG